MEPSPDQKSLSASVSALENNAVDSTRGTPPAPPVAAETIPATQDAIATRNLTADPGKPEDDAQRRLRTLSRRGFVVGGTAVVAGVGGWRWLVTRGDEGGLPWPLRRALEFDERLARGLFRPSRLSPQFPRFAARIPRVNGSIGLDANLDLAEWRLQVIGSAGERSRRSFTLDDIKAFPRTEMTTELRCVEGWSDVVHWAGARLADLAKATGLATRAGRPLGYASLQTPDGQYYVGLDIASALHPQTLLCYEMNGQPLTPEHGAPLRLAIPVKYGIKNLKRIGTIQFTDARPVDYWAERGYDWYAGH
jgi:DMSO/TMAO reductase YedYZ molybdopterin-dependent catalytic subunit